MKDIIALYLSTIVTKKQLNNSLNIIEKGI